MVDKTQFHNNFQEGAKAMIKHLIAATFILCALYLVQPANADTPACTFLRIQPDARFTGMGGAGSALADGAIATFYNPAGITGVDRTSFHANYYKWLPGLGLNDMYYDHLSGVINLNLLGFSDLGCVGMGVTRLS